QFEQCAIGKSPKLFQSLFDDRASDFATHVPISPFRVYPLDHSQPLHAGMPVLADDEVIVQGDAERAGDVDDRFCHLDIRLRWRRIAGRVVVHETTIAAIGLSTLSFFRLKKTLGMSIGDCKL